MEQHTVRRSAFRWPGLVAFLVIVGLIAAFSWLLLDTILKWSLERTLGTLNGAEVNIERVEHQWVPLTVELSGIQVTDPLQPDFNRVAVGDVRGELSWEQLLMGRFHFEDVVSTGIRVHTPRETTGEVYQLPSKEQVGGWFGEGIDKLQLSMPSVDEVMARVDLHTPAAVAEAKTSFEQQQERVKAVMDKLPSKERLATYEAELKALTEGKIETPVQLQERKEKFAELKEKFAADRQALQEFKEIASTAAAELKTQMEKVKAAPQRDLDRVGELLQMNSQGLSEITTVLFGEQARRWADYMLLAYEQLAPMLMRSADETALQPPRGEGIWFSFTGSDAPPDFLIKKARTEFAIGPTVLDVDWANITHQHQQLGQPTTFRARGENNALWSSLQLNGELALTEAGFDARQEWRVQGVNLARTALSERSELAASILSALLDSEGNVALRNSQFDGNATLRLADMVIEASAENQWAAVIAKALESLQRLDINADLKGELMNPDFSLSSDLDRQLGQALQAAAKDAAKGELADLRQRLTSQSDGFVGEYQEELTQLTSLLTDAENREARLQEMLEMKLQNQLEDKVKDKLKGLLGNG
ncbi:TIGR03545 family protein [Pseudidiomarina sp. 1APP75-32.1]|uniref:TIGR03545 family protein n=1 Tax=Pseudidiomarina terrestris TaxID=2820060 RepID=A0AAW7R0E7_9GAMM|nr:TIGR03545 family protein [Pseudidiomarina sp. 1APP75-32.1]MDN7125166.1 TIGR03545 family protein [Pseudidiomarina sp. 1APP75-32.1]